MIPTRTTKAGTCRAASSCRVSTACVKLVSVLICGVGLQRKRSCTLGTLARRSAAIPTSPRVRASARLVRLLVVLLISRDAAGPLVTVLLTNRVYPSDKPGMRVYRRGTRRSCSSVSAAAIRAQGRVPSTMCASASTTPFTTLLYVALFILRAMLTAGFVREQTAAAGLEQS